MVERHMIYCIACSRCDKWATAVGGGICEACAIRETHTAELAAAKEENATMRATIISAMVDVQHGLPGNGHAKLSLLLDGIGKAPRNNEERLLAELAEVREDRARLEAVQRGNWTVHYRSMHSRWEVMTDHAHPAHRKTYTGKTARAAIDAAREGEENDG